ncbi:hypothetical protein ABN16_09615 [Levilactobacillus koreensis]|uniref:Uncharacterized protein n=1 Tax=Levilactobacillus koreensis TaxID=637971 RepID=A0AAC8UWJ6_9LACO|nr:hypothetical protein ABN16_09615 [Levilactobacillus koreensis]
MRYQSARKFRGQVDFNNRCGRVQSEPEDARDVASCVDDVCRGSFPTYIVRRPERHAAFVAFRRAGSPLHRLEAFPTAGGIPGSRSAAISHQFIKVNKKCAQNDESF